MHWLMCNHCRWAVMQSTVCCARLRTGLHAHAMCARRSPYLSYRQVAVPPAIANVRHRRACSAVGQSMAATCTC